VAAPEQKTALATERRKAARARGKSKSSTMPGFQERNVNLSGRRRAHRDGIRIAEKKSGKELRNIVNTETSTTARRRANSMAMYRSSASVPDSLVAYTKEIHQATQRITPAEEKELGGKTQAAIRLQEIYSSLQVELNREPTDEEWCTASDGVDSVEELRAIIEEGMGAKNRLVEANLRMVQGVVNMYIRNGLGSQYNAGDLMQEGTMALIRAAEKFEPERGLRFSTYAMYWIRSAVKRSQILQSRVIQVPQRLHETHKRVQKTERGLKAELGRPPTDEELAKSSDLSELQLGRCKKAMGQKCFSLDATIQNKFKPGTGGQRKDTMLEIVNSRFEDEQYGKTQQQLMKDALVDSLRNVLSPHEVDLLLLRFGLMDERTLPHGFAGPLTIAEVSRLVGLKPDKVRRMINKCLSKLRPVMETEWMDYQSMTIF
jgi:RNA polymerase primary sigma factor